MLVVLKHTFSFILDLFSHCPISNYLSKFLLSFSLAIFEAAKENEKKQNFSFMPLLYKAMSNPSCLQYAQQKEKNVGDFKMFFFSGNTCLAISAKNDVLDDWYFSFFF